jgi:RNA polymerase sigma-70 factor (ECF subfamily)
MLDEMANRLHMVKGVASAAHPSRLDASVPSPFATELIALLPRLRRFARSLTGSTDRADDLVQAACERALRAADRFEPGTRLDAWLFRIIRNLWIDGLRAHGQDPSRHLPIEAAEAVPNADGPARIEATLTLAKVRAAIAELPEQHREVIVLVCIEGLSYRDTAEVLDVPIGTVMSRLARARAKLAEALGTTPDQMLGDR